MKSTWWERHKGFTVTKFVIVWVVVAVGWILLLMYTGWASGTAN